MGKMSNAEREEIIRQLREDIEHHRSVCKSCTLPSGAHTCPACDTRVEREKELLRLYEAEVASEKRVVELEAENVTIGSKATISELNLHKAEKRIAELEAALSPIADAALSYISACVKSGIPLEKMHQDMAAGRCGVEHFYGPDLLRAAKAMHPDGPEKGGE